MRFEFYFIVKSYYKISLKCVVTKKNIRKKKKQELWRQKKYVWNDE